ncbi:MAG: DNA-directed RNA polymerase [Halobacteria archaeon]
MYKRARLVDTVRVPPQRLENVDEDLILELLQDKLEGRCDEKLGWVVGVTDVHSMGEGKILYNEGGVYYEAEFDAIVFEPIMQEVIEGKVSEVVNFGVFVSLGPIDALLHASQIGDEYYSFDGENERLHSSETNREIGVGDVVRGRIVTVSIDERNPGDSKIGLTARQVGLGKLGWLEEEARKQESEA